MIFAAGSFSAFLYPELQTRVRNQFYILDVDTPGTVSGTSGIAGRIRAWEYNAAFGWVQPQSDEGIPDSSGFGFRGSVAHAASLIADNLKKETSGSFVALNTLLALSPELYYLLPMDRTHVLAKLASDGITVSPKKNYWTRGDEIFLRMVT